MLAAAADLQFERAAVLRDQVEALRNPGKIESGRKKGKRYKKRKR